MMFKMSTPALRQKRRLSYRIYNRFLQKYFVHDINFELQLMARHEAATYVKNYMGAASMFTDRWSLLDAAVSEAPPAGLFLEFGVEKGTSTNFIARRMNQHTEEMLHAFDSFEGLPNDWVGTFERIGHFSTNGRIPRVLRNVQIHNGRFDQQLMQFTQQYSTKTIAFVHIDCDIYSSTNDILRIIGNLLSAGSVIVFDEYFNYHGWEYHEYRAWQEFVAQCRVRYTYRGFCARGGHVYVRVEGIG